jgi:hypothetical protein
MDCNILMRNYFFQLSLHYSTSWNYNAFWPSRILLSPHTLGRICYSKLFLTHATYLEVLSISLCRLEVPFCNFQRQIIIFFHIYVPYKLDSMHICRLHHYNPCTSSFVLKIKNCVGFPCHVTRSMILDLPYTGNVLTRPFSSI